jgi:hypothetical protein
VYGAEPAMMLLVYRSWVPEVTTLRAGWPIQAFFWLEWDSSNGKQGLSVDETTSLPEFWAIKLPALHRTDEFQIIKPCALTTYT